ncbi:MAG: tRNA pseudouridine(55) synthase TruB [Ruminococcus sp.]|nr:tRNA pseudouridine(55) synthase TruB [Ruminococcus sp.]
MKTNNGILIINKPKDYTSRDIVNIVGKEFETKKIGHTGTLDPLATGVLVLCLGRYTKLVDMLSSLEKTYIAEIKLGVLTDTLDITGNIIDEKEFNITKDDILKAFNSFIGKYEMEVPIYSAVKVNGRKLYEYARNNEEVKLPIKVVEIYDLELLEFKDDIIKFKARVEKGTYIRSLIRDLCKYLNTVGVMNNLTRIKQGYFSLDDAYTLDDIKSGNYKLLSAREALNIDIYNLSNDEYFKVRNGSKMGFKLNSKYILLMYDNEEIAIYEKDQDLYKCYIMLQIS